MKTVKIVIEAVEGDDGHYYVDTANGEIVRVDDKLITLVDYD